jgi:hypothetical protein
LYTLTGETAEEHILRNVEENLVPAFLEYKKPNM